MITFERIECERSKSDICGDILRALPKWFGNSAAIEDYISKVRKMPFFAALDGTRSFYLKMGFVPLEVFPLHWEADNPCLFLAKYVGKSR